LQCILFDILINKDIKHNTLQSSNMAKSLQHQADIFPLNLGWKMIMRILDELKIKHSVVR